MSYAAENIDVSTQSGTALLAALAADNAVLAAEPVKVGDHGLLVRRPADWVAEVIDERASELHARNMKGARKFATVESLVRYVNRFKDENTLGYITDVTGRGAAVLAADVSAAYYVIDDWHRLDEQPMNRDHTASLVLRPTTAARRWAAALTQPLTQVGMVELVIDGVGEIANPAAADLRDLISDLHAIRNSSAKSVIRTGGGLAVEVNENVSLHAGTGNLVEVPDTLTLVLQPWTAVDATITVEVKIRPTVNAGEQVSFRLSAPHLEEALNEVLRTIHADLSDTEAAGTGINPFWTA